MNTVKEKRYAWIAYTNSDCTEGRGYDIPIAVCETEETAIRLARRSYVQGMDGPVRKHEIINIDGQWYFPSQAINLIKPSKDDIQNQITRNNKNAALKKAKDAGLTDEELAYLR